MAALLFGSISTLGDTSEEQRGAFNAAFVEHGLSWHWRAEEYRDLLTSSGGQDRIAAYADERGEQVDAAAVHASKSQIFQRALASAPLLPRPGVVETITATREAGWKLGLVTTTSPDNVAALLSALDRYFSPDSFDVVVDVTSVDEPKPAPAAYEYALRQLGTGAEDCVAIEDNIGGVRSAQAAGIRCVAFPNANTVMHDFGSTPISRRLDFAELHAAVAGR